MTDYNDLIDAFAQVIEESEGTVPDTGIALMYGSEIYAAYAWNYHYEPSDLSDFYSDAEDAFVGEYPSDEAFAERYAEECGMIDDDAQWPTRHIDWEAAASELMMDYWEKNELYFRN